MEMLSVQAVTKKFGGLVANNNISLEVGENEIVGLIGPNGAGKTTLFNCIAGVYRIDEGKILFKGKPIQNLRSDQVCSMGIGRTFQVMEPFKGMSVLENVMVGAFSRTHNANIVRKKSEEIVEFCGLGENIDKLAANLSTAGKKRLELARALSTEPKFLLLDEVGAGLNPSETHTLVELIKRIHKDMGLSILIVEHIMELLLPLVNRVVVLNFGEKISEGNPAVVMKNETVIKAYLGEHYNDKNK